MNEQIFIRGCANATRWKEWKRNKKCTFLFNIKCKSSGDIFTFSPVSALFWCDFFKNFQKVQSILKCPPPKKSIFLNMPLSCRRHFCFFFQFSAHLIKKNCYILYILTRNKFLDLFLYRDDAQSNKVQVSFVMLNAFCLECAQELFAIGFNYIVAKALRHLHI